MQNRYKLLKGLLVTKIEAKPKLHTHAHTSQMYTRTHTQAKFQILNLIFNYLK